MDISNNRIPDKQAQEIDKLVRHNRLKPITEDRNQTRSDLNLSHRFLDAEDALVVAEYVKNNGAMTSLNISSNHLGAEGAKHIAAALPECK